MRGAGGTGGGIGRFFLGLGMMIGGGYLFFNAVQVHNNFHFNRAIFSPGGFSITSGMVLVPFLIGIVMVFYNSKNIIGWILSFGSLLALLLGVISSVNFRIRTMSSFDLIVILVLLFGGIGLFVSSVRDFDDRSA